MGSAGAPPIEANRRRTRGCRGWGLPIARHSGWVDAGNEVIVRDDAPADLRCRGGGEVGYLRVRAGTVHR